MNIRKMKKKQLIEHIDNLNDLVGKSINSQAKQHEEIQKLRRTVGEMKQSAEVSKMMIDDLDEEVSDLYDETDAKTTQYDCTIKAMADIIASMRDGRMPKPY